MSPFLYNITTQLQSIYKTEDQRFVSRQAHMFIVACSAVHLIFFAPRLTYSIQIYFFSIHPFFFFVFYSSSFLSFIPVPGRQIEIFSAAAQKRNQQPPRRGNKRHHFVSVHVFLKFDCYSWIFSQDLTTRAVDRIPKIFLNSFSTLLSSCAVPL